MSIDYKLLVFIDNTKYFRIKIWNLYLLYFLMFTYTLILIFMKIYYYHVHFEYNRILRFNPSVYFYKIRSTSW